VFQAGVRVADRRPLGDYVAEAIETELRSEGLPADTVSQLDRNDVRVAKTASRRTLGFMKEIAFELEWHITYGGGLDATDNQRAQHARRSRSCIAREHEDPVERGCGTASPVPSPLRAGVVLLSDAARLALFLGDRWPVGASDNPFEVVFVPGHNEKAAWFERAAS
jgi:hypothetical protein